MFSRYNIVTDTETAAALKHADAWLSTQPTITVAYCSGDTSLCDNQADGTLLLWESDNNSCRQDCG